jgi:DNA polymerase III subunit beta
MGLRRAGKRWAVASMDGSTMKTRLPRQEFLDALVAVAAVASARTTKPILSCVRIASEGDTIELSATDGELALRLAVSSFAVEEPGEVVVPADRLLGIVREMPDAEIRLTADDRYAVVRGAGSEFKIFVQPAVDFPAIPTFEDKPDMVLDGRQLARMIGLTLYAAARETSRYAINGVLWEKRGKRLFLVATDGRRLARAGGPVVESSSGDFEAIVPAKALNVFERVFGPLRDQENWRVDVAVLPNQLLLRSGERMVSTVLVEGNFPKYEDVIPKENNRIARVNRSELHSAIKRAALLTSDEARAVKLSFQPGQLTITASSPEQGEARVELPVEFEGSVIEIGFNPNFVNDALRALTMESVRVELQDVFRPGVLCGEDKAEFLYVVMPVSL